MIARTLYRKIWEAHQVAALSGGESLIYIDRHFLYEVTSPQAFEGLRESGRGVRRPEATLAMANPTCRPRIGLPGSPVSQIQKATFRSRLSNAMRRNLEFLTSR